MIAKYLLIKKCKLKFFLFKSLDMIRIEFRSTFEQKKQFFSNKITLLKKALALSGEYEAQN